jgi:hypothetical protein
MFNELIAEMVANGWEVFWKSFMTITTNGLKFHAFVRFTRNGNFVELSAQDVYTTERMESEIAKFYKKVKFLKEKGMID